MQEIKITDIHRLINARMDRHEAIFHRVVAPTITITPHTEQPKTENLNAKWEEAVDNLSAHLAPKRNRNAEHWHQCISDLHDLVALSVYRNYITHPQTSELLDVLKRLRILVNRYEAEEQEARS